MHLSKYTLAFNINYCSCTSCICYCECYAFIIGVLSTAAGVLHDQAEADENMSLQQRLILAGGSALEGTSEMVDNEVISGAMQVGG